MAVDLAKMSLWLVTLARDHALTFVDHALRHGDSLLGLSRKQIETFHWDTHITYDSPFRAKIRADVARAAALRQRIRDAGENVSDLRRRDLWAEAQSELVNVRLFGDLPIVAFFEAEKPKERERKRLEYVNAIVRQDIEPFRGRLEALRYADPPLAPFHWEIEFPEVFERERPGFDAFVGNPPFSGKNSVIAGNVPGYPDWLQELHDQSHGNADLVAHFFRRAFDLLREGGAFGLIATNTIAQGDARASGLRWICTHGGEIFAARRRVKWVGMAAVVVSVVHIVRGRFEGMKRLDEQEVETITAFLFHRGGHEDPVRLAANAGKSFVGSYVLGMGFTFDNSDTKGVATPIAEMRRLIEKDPRNQEVIFPYIGGEEVNTSPTQAHYRYVIDFRDWSAERAASYPDCWRIVELKVKPQRQRTDKNGEFVLRDPLPQRYWHYAEKRPGLYAAIAGLERVLAIARISNAFAFTFLPDTMVYNEKVVVFPLSNFAPYCALQGRVHEVWGRFFNTSLKDDMQYTPSDCFETFPFPENWENNLTLEAAGRAHYEFRVALMIRNNEGLTKTHNRFHNPDERDSDILKLRELHEAMDRAVLGAYGWHDIPTECEFLLDYDIDEEEWGDKKKPYRYRWPDEVRDEVLARLLELNAERAKEEARSGAAAVKKGASKAMGMDELFLMNALIKYEVPATSVEVRERLVEALKLDLVGPSAGHALAEERLPGWVRPSNWYLTGFLIPSGTAPEKSADADEDDDMGGEVPESAGLAEESNEERKAAKKGFFPSSMGLSFLVPDKTHALVVTVRWGDYAQTEIEGPSRQALLRLAAASARGDGFCDAHRGDRCDGARRARFRRPPAPCRRAAGLSAGSRGASPAGHALGLGLPREPPHSGRAGTRGARPRLRIPARDSRCEANALSCRGRTCAARGPQSGTSRWPTSITPTRLNMRLAMAFRSTGKSWTARAICFALPGFRAPRSRRRRPRTCRVSSCRWSARGPRRRRRCRNCAAAARDALPRLDRGTASEPLRLSRERAARRPRSCCALRILQRTGSSAASRVLAQDADALDAFRVANRAVARALRKRLKIETPRWRAFQLAFILLNLPGPRRSARPQPRDGGPALLPDGRRQDRGLPGARCIRDGAAAAAPPGRAGARGRRRQRDHALHAAPAHTGSARPCRRPRVRAGARAREGHRALRRVALRDRALGGQGGDAEHPRAQGGRSLGFGAHEGAAVQGRPASKPSPIPLENCPWCGTRFGPDSFALLPNDDQPIELRIVCTNFECDFTRDRALPIVAVDEPIYRRLPAFLIATVDKFASLPWVGQAGALLGGADAARRDGFLRRRGPGQGHAPRHATAAARPRDPGRAAPDLRSARHDGRALRDGDRGAVHARDRRPSGAAQDRRLDRHRAPGAGPDPGALRAAADAGFPAARPRPARLVLRPDGAGLRDARAALSRDRSPGPQPEGHDAQGLACAHGRRRALPTATRAGTITTRTRPTRT